MCDGVSAAMAVLAVASAAVNYQAQNEAQKASVNVQQAAIDAQSEITNANIKNQYAQSLLRIGQEKEATSQKMEQASKQALQQRATAMTAAGEANVSGLSVAALARDMYQQESQYKEAANRNYQMQSDQMFMDMRGFHADARSQLNSMPRTPMMGGSLIGAGLQAASGIVGGFANNQRITAGTTPTANNKAYTPGQAGGTVFLNGRTSSGRF
jgi:hypothetical protein